MWEDFMRGNWPAAAPAADAEWKPRPDAAEVASPVVRGSHRTPVGAAIATNHAGRTRAVAVKAAFAAGAAMLLGALLPAAALAGDAGQGAAHAQVNARNGPLVALGDSYAAGNLIPVSPAGSPAACLRSTRNYSAIAAAALHMTYVDAACTGATTGSMTEAEPLLIGTDPPQFRSLAPGDSVVTLTIGGNDVGFRVILLACGLLSFTDPFGAPCERHYTSGGTDRIAAAIRASAPKVAAVLQGIRARAPHARILLVGYPDIMPNTGHGCFPVVPFAFGDVPYLRGAEIELNQMLAAAAAANGARFVDTYKATIGHDVCTSADVKDVEGLIPTSLAYPFHPNWRGQQAMATQVLAALARH